MCGRYYFDIDEKELKEIVQEVQNNINEDFKTGEIYPTNTAPIITPQGVILAKWGFPKWDGKGSVINARVETLTERKMFKTLIKANRCIVPASSYFEWKKISETSKLKNKYLIKNPNSILYMAGLYDSFQNENKQLSMFDTTPQETIQYTIITKKANTSVSYVHDRMPLIFTKEEIHTYLNGEDLHTLLDNNNIFLEYAIL